MVVALLLAPGCVFADSLYVMPEGVETRWASSENPKGERGKGASTNAGRKGVPAPVYFQREIRVTLQQIGFIWSNDGTPENPIDPPIYQAGSARDGIAGAGARRATDPEPGLIFKGVRHGGSLAGGW